mgnify:CR=1 FL=1
MGIANYYRLPDAYKDFVSLLDEQDYQGVYSKLQPVAQEASPQLKKHVTEDCWYEKLDRVIKTHTREEIEAWFNTILT